MVRLLFLVFLAGGAGLADEFARSIRPVLAENCSACHNPDNPKNRVTFLRSQTADDMQTQRGLWRNVAAQLRNRTMPPVASKLTEDDRLRISMWIDDQLRKTACNAGDFAGAVTVRRLNRRDYRNTVRDLFGVDLTVTDIFPEDGSGGEGFDTNGETLYIPPLMMERYLQAAQQILDRVIVTPTFRKNFSGWELQPQAPSKAMTRTITPGEELSGTVSVYSSGEYEVKISVERPTKSAVELALKVDGVETGSLKVQRYESKGGATRSNTVRLSKGIHKISIQARDLPLDLYYLSIDQRAQQVSAEQKALHYRLFGMEPGEAPLNARRTTRQLLARIARNAYRRPVELTEVDPFLKLYDRGAERGDPFEESVKLALKGLLVSPKFLFRIEEPSTGPGIHPLKDHEIATRLSYFLWSTMPDEELSRLADEGRLKDPAVLVRQVDRMLDDPRARVFASNFAGQWLGTKDVGGRLVPLIGKVQHFYTPDVAVDLREQPVVFFHSLLADNRSLLDLLDSDYTFLTERLVKFYQLEGQVQVQGNVFQKVIWPDRKRGGLVGLGSILAMTSHTDQTSPVLRGAWILDTLLGVTVPPPPADVPPLNNAAAKKLKLTMREQLTKHRENPTCAACHNLMDPMGFALENFDWMGRWRDEDNGHPVDASAVTPSGERFNGPIELRQVLLRHKDEFLRQITGKVLGYALGRSLQDGDHCTIQRIMDAVRKDDYRARTLIRQVVLSIPFRNSQAGMPAAEITSGPKRQLLKAEPK